MDLLYNLKSKQLRHENETVLNDYMAQYPAKFVNTGQSKKHEQLEFEYQ